MEKIRIVGVTLSAQDRVAYGMFWPGLWLATRLPLLAVLVLWVGACLAVEFGYLSVDFLLGIGLAVVIYHGALLIAKAWIQRHVWRENGLTPIGLTPLDWTLDDNGFSQNSSAFQSAVPWTSVCDVREQPGRFIFTISPANWVILPKRFMAGEAEIQAVRTLIENKRTDGSIRGVDSTGRRIHKRENPVD